ncbi:MAG: L-threonylcarbamoyladenylate synthase, partial [Parvularculaceae bacterium]
MPKLSLKTIERAAAHLSAGELVAVPTETVYGLAADASNDIAIARIFAAKARPSFNPLIVHVPDLTMAAMLGRFSTLARKLATEFWPGPLTLVVPRRANIPVSKLISAGLDTIALRVPDAPIARDLLAAFGKPFAAPSANPSGQISPTTAPHVRNGLGDKVAMILDGGPCPVGIESTILAIDENDVTLLRPGGVAIEEIEALIGPVTRPTSSAILAP